MAKAPKKDDPPEEPDKQELDEALDEELEDTFPASDPPSTTRPGHGATGPEVKREKD